MTTITLEVLENIALDIESMGEELPVLLAITHRLFQPVDESDAHTTPVYNERLQADDRLSGAWPLA